MKYFSINLTCLILEITSLSANSASLLGGLVLNIEVTYFYSDDELPAIIEVGGKDFFYLKKKL